MVEHIPESSQTQDPWYCLIVHRNVISSVVGKTRTARRHSEENFFTAVTQRSRRIAVHHAHWSGGLTSLAITSVAVDISSMRSLKHVYNTSWPYIHEPNIWDAL